MLEGTSHGALPTGHRGMSQVQEDKVRVERVRAAGAREPGWEQGSDSVCLVVFFGLMFLLYFAFLY